MRKTKYLAVLCAVICLITALSVSAYAASSVTDQMAANSAAWHIANAAGDTATCNALHEANVALANQASSGGGSANFNSSSGTWDITTSSGSSISSSGSSNGKSNSISYTTTTSSGSTSQSTNSSYTDSSIAAYKNYGGTNSGLQTAYNNAGTKVSSSGEYGDQVAITTASSEAAVAKALLGLTDAQAKKLQTDLEKTKNAFVEAQNEYEAAVKAGNTAAADAARAKMDSAHDAAQATREGYGYTGDSSEYTDGGYYYGDGKPKPSDGGGFYVSDIKPTFNITASTNEGGTISPSGTVAVKRAESQTFTVVPATGYKIKSVTVDDSNQGAISTYTFTNVTKAHTITVAFEKLKYSITASTATGGSISPTGATSVEYGSSKTYTITPASGYEIANVVVDGSNKGKLSSYTFTNVTGSHTISATFKANGTISIGGADITDAIGADLSGGTIKSGYGFFASVNGSHSGVTNAKMTLTYNFGKGSKSVTLQETSTGMFEFPKNADSPTNKRCVYIPVETKDGSYTLTLTFSAKKADGQVLTETKTVTVTVKGTMYEDDFTGDS